MSQTRRSRGSKPRTEITSLIATLESKNGLERQDARLSLVEVGAPAVPLLLHCLKDPAKQVRWEAAKALVSIKDATAAPALVDALMDRNTEVRWLAAEGLIALERSALGPLLLALEKHFESVWLRQGAHHVLHALERDRLLHEQEVAVLDALRSLVPKFAVPGAAQKALSSLRKVGS